MNDLDRLRTAAQTADGVIHAAFNHDFSNLKQNSEDDRKVIEALGEVLAGPDRPDAWWRCGPMPPSVK